MKSFAPDGEKEFETAGLFIFGALSLIMAILKLVYWNSPLAKPSRKGDKFFDHMAIQYIHKKCGRGNAHFAFSIEARRMNSERFPILPSALRPRNTARLI